jgi:hypothetical protein
VTKTHEMIPGARRLVSSLRDLGYDFASAVADIVDNSISARAKTVTINVNFAGDDSWVCIADDGDGMSPAGLREAMRYGAQRSYELDELGKFGLGLKTASMSQCQRLTVATRSGQDRARIAAYCWDLTHIIQTDRWEITTVDVKNHSPDLTSTLREQTGTVVLWQRLDRILGYQYGESARKRLANMCRELEQHLSMVFHRFLAGEVRGKKLTILLNGNAIRPWDPYARDESNTLALEPQSIRVGDDSVSGFVAVTPYILPAQSRFSTPTAFNAASGPNKWNRQQGLYIYRGGRLIQSGGWSGLRTLDEHTKLARIGISFGTELDDAFKINVAKMRVQLPSILRTALEDCLGPVVKKANIAYRASSGSVERTPQIQDAAHTRSHQTLTAPVREIRKAPLIQVTAALTANTSDGSPIVGGETQKGSSAITSFEFDQLDAALELIAANATPEEARVLQPLIARMKLIAGGYQPLDTKQEGSHVKFA